MRLRERELESLTRRRGLSRPSHKLLSTRSFLQLAWRNRGIGAVRVWPRRVLNFLLQQNHQLLHNRQLLRLCFWICSCLLRTDWVLDNFESFAECYKTMSFAYFVLDKFWDDTIFFEFHEQLFYIWVYLYSWIQIISVQQCSYFHSTC